MQASQVCKSCGNTCIYKRKPKISEILWIQEVQMTVLWTFLEMISEVKKVLFQNWNNCFLFFSFLLPQEHYAYMAFSLDLHLVVCLRKLVHERLNRRTGGGHIKVRCPSQLWRQTVAHICILKSLLSFIKEIFTYIISILRWHAQWNRFFNDLVDR